LNVGCQCTVIIDGDDQYNLWASVYEATTVPEKNLENRTTNRVKAKICSIFQAVASYTEACKLAINFKLERHSLNLKRKCFIRRKF
jgi:uncharacterized protein YfcZ (UPF0381/DUF406 family)